MAEPYSTLVHVFYENVRWVKQTDALVGFGRGKLVCFLIATYIANEPFRGQFGSQTRLEQPFCD